jgi:hypothetical protein
MFFFNTQQEECIEKGSVLIEDLLTYEVILSGVNIAPTSQVLPSAVCYESERIKIYKVMVAFSGMTSIPDFLFPHTLSLTQSHARTHARARTHHDLSLFYLREGK